MADLDIAHSLEVIACFKVYSEAKVMACLNQTRFNYNHSEVQVFVSQVPKFAVHDIFIED